MRARGALDPAREPPDDAAVQVPGRANEPVGREIHHVEGGGERHQLPRLHLRQAKVHTVQRQPLPLLRQLDRHGGAVEFQRIGQVGQRDPVRGQPQVPAKQRLHAVDQPCMAQLLHRIGGNGAQFLKIAGAAQRQHKVVHDAGHRQPGPVAMAIAQVEIDALGFKGGEIGGGVDADVPFGIVGQKPRDPGAKPADTEAGADPDDQVAQIALPGDRAAHVAKRAKGLRGSLKQDLPVLGQGQAALFAAEKLDTELGFQMADLLADGRGRNAKLLRRLGDGAKPGDGFEILDCLDVDVTHGRRLKRFGFTLRK